MRHLLEKKDRWGNGMGLWVLVLMTALVPPALISLRGTHLDNDIRNWVPHHDRNALTLDWYHSHFPGQESVFIAWEGGTLNDPRMGWLAWRLEGFTDEEGRQHGGLKQVDRVVTPQELLRRIENSGVTHEEALQRLQGTLVGTGPLKLKLTETGRENQDGTLSRLAGLVKAELKIDLQSLPAATDYQPDEATVERISQALPGWGLREEEPQAAFPPLPAHDAQIRWSGMTARGADAEKIIAMAKSLSVVRNGETVKLVEDAFFAAGSPVTVAVILSKAGDEEKTESIELIRAAAIEVGVPAETIHLGGRPVANSALNQSVKKAAWNRDYPVWFLPGRSLILFSGAVGVLLAFLMLRSVILASLVLFVSYYSVLLTVALVPATGGSMNMVLVVMPTLLLVVTISGAIHLAGYWRFAAKTDLGRAPILAAEMARKPCVMASVTTAFGLLSLMTSPLKPVYDFGLYAAAGCIVGLLVILYVLPALLQFVPARVARVTAEHGTFWNSAGQWIANRHRLIGTLYVAVSLICTAGLVYFKSETKVIRYFPEHTTVVKDYRYLEENIGGIVPVDIVIRFAEEVRAPADDGMLLAQRQELVRRVQNRLIERHADVTGAVSLATFREARSEEQLETIASSPFQRRTELVAEGRVFENQAARSFVKLAGQDAVLKGGVTLCRTGDELWRITAQVNIMTDCDYSVLTRDIEAIIAEETAGKPGVDHVVTGMVPLFLETQKAILTSLIKSFGLAFLIVWGVMAWSVRSITGGLVLMLPNTLPITTVFGLISFYGIRVDIGTLITASIALGMAVDGTLHLLTWFRTGIEEGRSRNEAIGEAMRHCGAALTEASIVVGLGLLVLLPAELTLISRFGWLMATMVVAALIGDLVMMPALLAGWLGTKIMKTIEKQRESIATDESDPTGSSGLHAPHSSEPRIHRDDTDEAAA